MDTRVAFHLGELEAVLFASSRPLSTKALARRLGLSEKEVSWLLERYGGELEAPNRGLQLRESRGGWLLATKPLYEDVIRLVRAEGRELPLSAAALEILATIALHEPLKTRDVNQRRGRDSAAVLQTLRQRGLVKHTPSIFGGSGSWSTTMKFLTLVGLPSLEELHRPEVCQRVFEELRGAGRGKKRSP